ncbi:MAG: FAD-dependent oxidoreductase, partial [candidate division WS1 bacterium]|nr:FAD-dependent oxidoreductase [candidate division WS1 bacterium]
GRMLDADQVAFSAVRVMVNLNQTGEAAGVAAFVALDSGLSVQEVPASRVRELLTQGGSLIL